MQAWRMCTCCGHEAVGTLAVGGSKQLFSQRKNRERLGIRSSVTHTGVYKENIDDTSAHCCGRRALGSPLETTPSSFAPPAPLLTAGFLQYDYSHGIDRERAQEYSFQCCVS